MKRLCFLMLLNVSFIGIRAQTVAWAKKGGLWAYDYGYGIANDNSGNLYVAGKYEKNAKFNEVTLPCEGNHDMFVAQYSPSGNLNWIRTAGGASGDYAHALACVGNYVYAGGEIEGSGNIIKFPGSSITLKCKGANDVMFAKYSLNGTLVWARRAGGYNSEKVLGITADQSGNVFICGYYKYSTIFESTNLTAAGNEDIFIAKYDPNGTLLWVRSAGSSGRDEAKSIQCDPSGNVYITGLYSNGCKFGSQTLSALYYDAFIAKYSSNGTLIWVKRGGGKYNDVGWSLALDKYGNMYVGGEFNASSNFGGLTINTTGSSDVFVAKYDLNGNIKWIKKAGGSLSDRARGIACAGSNVYITGQFGKTAYFGPYTKTAADSSDIFVASLDNSGNFKWVTTAGGSADKYEEKGYESGNAICAEPSGNVYATGSTLDGATFGSTTLSAYSRTDVFIVKILSAPTREDEILAERSSENDSAAEEKVSILRSVIPELKQELNIYPNPGDGNFILEFYAKDNTEYDLFVYNSLGQIVENKKVIAPVSSSLDMSGREKGIYIVEVMNATERYRKKIILR
jgi:hypothetical protein